MTSTLGKVFKKLLWWGVPVAMVLLYTVGFYPMLVFSLTVGIGSAIFGDWMLEDVSPSAPMVALLIAGAVAISPRAAEAEVVYSMEVSVCVDQREGTEDCSTWETIKMNIKCVTCTGGALACGPLVKAAIKKANAGDHRNGSVVVWRWCVGLHGVHRGPQAVWCDFRTDKGFRHEVG